MDNIVTQIFIEQINSKHHLWLFITAFLGGIVASLSPCVLGLLPVIIGYVGGYSDNTDRKIVIQVIFFVIGLSLAMSFLGITAAATGRALGFQANPVWTVVIASLILIMGLNLLGMLDIPMPQIIKKMPQNTNKSMVLYPMFVGAAFALASSPCSTPILAGIMAYTSLKANIAFGALLLFSFAMGQGIILIIAGLFTSLFKKISAFKSISGYFLKFSGGILILAAVYLYLKVFQII